MELQDLFVRAVDAYKQQASLLLVCGGVFEVFVLFGFNLSTCNHEQR